MQEKIVAVSSREMVVIADASKAVTALGAFPLPVAVVPFGWETTLGRLTDTFQVPAQRRCSESGSAPFVTDDGLYIIDLRFGAIADPADLQHRLREIVGVAEVGLFVGVAHRVLLGSDDGTVEERKATS
jgi:ribose 5-phosphate isomerase A